MTSWSADLSSESFEDRHLYKAYYSAALLTVLSDLLNSCSNNCF